MDFLYQYPLALLFYKASYILTLGSVRSLDLANWTGAKLDTSRELKKYLSVFAFSPLALLPSGCEHSWGVAHGWMRQHRAESIQCPSQSLSHIQRMQLPC